MFSVTSLVICGLLILVAIVVIWKWWKQPKTTSLFGQPAVEPKEITRPPLEQENSDAVVQSLPKVYAINDDGNLDFKDESGRVLNSSFGPNPKTYIQLLDQVSMDVTNAVISEQGDKVVLVSRVGNSKVYEIAGNQYHVDFSELSRH